MIPPNLVNPLSTTARWRAHPGLGRAYVGVTAVTAGIGLALLAGGSQRASGRAFAIIRSTGGPTLWALVFLGCAALLVVAALLGKLRLIQGALIVGAIVHGLLGLWFGLAANSDPAVSFLGPIYSVGVLWHLVSQMLEYSPDAT